MIYIRFYKEDHRIIVSTDRPTNRQIKVKDCDAWDITIDDVYSLGYDVGRIFFYDKSGAERGGVKTLCSFPSKKTILFNL